MSVADSSVALINCSLEWDTRCTIPHAFYLSSFSVENVFFLAGELNFEARLIYRCYFFLFSPWLPSQSLLGSKREVIVSTRVKAVAVSLWDRGWGLGLLWGYQRTTQGVQEATSSCPLQLGGIQSTHSCPPSLFTAGGAALLICSASNFLV